jgi:hypothetical protein
MQLVLVNRLRFRSYDSFSLTNTANSVPLFNGWRNTIDKRMTSRTDKMSTDNSRAAYMREYWKRKLLEDNRNNVSKRTKLNAKRQHEYRETHKNLSAEL